MTPARANGHLSIISSIAGVVVTDLGILQHLETTSHY